ncbi:ketopantoate reductase family protein [Sporomusa malonica]|uniref:2-dehydropantoate 2-reductase n=1 Tax=Sporomusa malonica TaxID=112901 RepID=A0A1W2EE10_9FIRM|nr:ketopantoate reductase family protein [Sporomusa malonica]SMD07632.1 2-dehydropantoate 2-reductase [Sporomusa malonica]
MRFAIIGAGVMGSLVGTMLKKAGAEVWLVDTNETIVKHIQNNGLKINITGTDEIIKINAVQSPMEIGKKMDVIIFLVKGCYTEAAAQSAKCLAAENTYIMTLQNGIGNVEILAKYYDMDHILYGVLEFAGKLIDIGHIRGFIGNNSKICFGSTQKIINDDLKEIAELFGKSGIKVILREDIDSEVWLKLRNNSINVLFGLLRLTMGQALSAEGTEELMKAVMDEVIAIARANGIQFTDDQLSVNGGKTPINPELYGHLPSTAQDMKSKTKTEVEFINGAIYREGLRLGVPTPNNELLYKMIKIIEATYDMQY